MNYLRKILILGRASLFAAVLSFISFTSAHAQDVWNGNGSDDLWTDGANWSTSNAPASSATSGIDFAGTTDLTPDMNANWTASALLFDAYGGDSTAGAFTLLASPSDVLTLQSTYQTYSNIAAYTSSVETVDLPINMQDDLAVQGNVAIENTISNEGYTFISEGGTGTTIAGNLAGSGGLTSLYQLNVTGDSTYTGATTVLGYLSISGNSGALSNTGSITVNSSPGEGLSIGDSSSTVADPDRLNHSVMLNLESGYFGLTGSNNSAITSQQVGQVSLLGNVTIELQQGNSSTQTELAGSSLNEGAGGTALILGDNLGGTGANSSRILFSTAPNMIGGGGAVGTPEVSIVPFLIGGTADSGQALGFVTYGSSGLRLLTSNEYAPSLAAAGSADNVMINSSESLSGSRTVNSILFSPNSPTVDIGAGNILNVTSGAVGILGGGSSSVLTGGTLNFGNNTGYILNQSYGAYNGTTFTPPSINSVIAGSNGLVITNNLILGGANTFTGNIYDSGSLTLTNSLALGVSTNTLTLGRTLTLSPGLTIANNIQLYGFQGGVTSTGNSTLNGNITVSNKNSYDYQEEINSQSGTLNIDGNLTESATPNSSVAEIYGTDQEDEYQFQGNGRTNVNGIISNGTAATVDLEVNPNGTSGILELKGNNTYSGFTTVYSGTLLANSQVGSATGSSGITVNSGGTLAGIGHLLPTLNGGQVQVNNGGNLQPGDPSFNNGIGKLSLGSTSTPAALELLGGANLTFALGNAASSQVALTGNLYLFGSAVAFNITDAGNAIARDYQLLTYTGSIAYGDFSDLELGNTPQGWQGTLVDDTANKSIDYDLTRIAPTPEPSTCGLLLGALVVLAFLHYRARSVALLISAKQTDALRT